MDPKLTYGSNHEPIIFFSDNASSTIFTILISLHPLVSFYNTKTNMSKILGFILTQKSTRGDCSLKNIYSRTRSFSMKKPAKKIYIRSSDRFHDLYDPKKSNAGEIVIEQFIQDTLSRDLDSVPGIEYMNKSLFKRAGITVPHQLIAVYLGMCDTTDNPVEICDRFYRWVEEIGIHMNRDTIVEVIARKANSLVPGIYDEDAY